MSDIVYPANGFPEGEGVPASRAGLGSCSVQETATKSYVVAGIGVVKEGTTVAALPPAGPMISLIT